MLTFDFTLKAYTTAFNLQQIWMHSRSNAMLNAYIENSQFRVCYSWNHSLDGDLWAHKSIIDMRAIGIILHHNILIRGFDGQFLFVGLEICNNIAE